MAKVTVFWMRRDLRLHDNKALTESLKASPKVLPLFIFDRAILEKLHDKNDARVTFIHNQLAHLKKELNEKYHSDLHVLYGDVLEVFKELTTDMQIEKVFTNHDYEPAAVQRDEKIAKFLESKKIEFHTFKDQVIFERDEVVSDTGKNYTVYTPYKKKWLKQFETLSLKPLSIQKLTGSFLQVAKPSPMPSLKEMGFEASTIQIPAAEFPKAIIERYNETRDFPAVTKGTSRLGCHLRFGTISVRELALAAKDLNETYLSEIIWRDFFMQILHHYPRVVSQSFRPEYDLIAWRKSSSDFEKWCTGQTGYPIVDAGMRELNETGHMHNRVRMIVASFLTKHLLIHWSEGERYFARKLLDYDLSANNGNWQWAAGSGCDAAPYFRIFNPYTQTEKFDPEMKYVDMWVPERKNPRYAPPIVDHVQARERCLTEFKKGLAKKTTTKIGAEA